ncbi:uncharacterized protein [Montipora capricornis]|uniref:uncharacterized protein n=1 Tax=Montipora capricornis TaxID=246305 RepID=UPI0035F0FD15
MCYFGHIVWRIFRRERTDENYEQYKCQRNKCTSLRRKAIREDFRRKSLESENPREFWSAYRPFLNSKTKQANDIILKEDNIVINDKKEIADLFNNYFVQTADCAAQVSEADYGQDYEINPSILAIHERNTKGYFKFQHTNQALVEKLLRDINVRKSCGQDMISPRLLKESTAVIAGPIANIINSSVDLSHIESSTAVRRSLLRMTEEWRSMRDDGQLVGIVSMDLSKAFDVIQHPLLLAKLKAYGLDKDSCALFRNYLSNRQQRVKIGESFSSWESVRRGEPQGSVLGRILFNIFINDLFYHVKRENINAYADDHQIYYSDTDPVALEECLCKEVEVANQWYSENGMIVNKSKHQA